MRPVWFSVTAAPEHAERATAAALEAVRPYARRVELRLGAGAPAQAEAAWAALHARWTGPLARLAGRVRAVAGASSRPPLRFAAADDDSWASLLELAPWATVDLVGDGQAEVGRTVEGGTTCVVRLTPAEGADLRERLGAGAAADEGRPVTVTKLASNRTWYDVGTAG